MTTLALNVCSWWGCCGNKLWVINLERSNLIAQTNECRRRGGNQALL